MSTVGARRVLIRDAEKRSHGDRAESFAQMERKQDERSRVRGLTMLALVICQYLLPRADSTERALQMPKADVLSERQAAMQAESKALFERMNDLSKGEHGAHGAVSQTNVPIMKRFPGAPVFSTDIIQTCVGGGGEHSGGVTALTR